jgi:hypothetical protein
MPKLTAVNRHTTFSDTFEMLPAIASISVMATIMMHDRTDSIKSGWIEASVVRTTYHSPSANDAVSSGMYFCTSFGAAGAVKSIAEAGSTSACNILSKRIIDRIFLMCNS